MNLECESKLNFSLEISDAKRAVARQPGIPVTGFPVDNAKSEGKIIGECWELTEFIRILVGLDNTGVSVPGIPVVNNRRQSTNDALDFFS